MVFGKMAESAISVSTKFYPTEIFCYFFKTNVTIDGITSTEPWGTSIFPVKPGRHEVRISYQSFISKNKRENSVVVDVAPGATVQISYHTPRTSYKKAPIHVV